MLSVTSIALQVEASNATQPDETPIPWGVGHLVNGSEFAAPLVTSDASPEGEESIMDTAWGILNGDEDQPESNSTAALNETMANANESTIQAGLSQTPTATALDGQWSPSSIDSGQWQGQVQGQGQATPPASSWNGSTATSPVSHNITGFMEGASCDIDNQCPEETPCCSEGGRCGTGR